MSMFLRKLKHSLYLTLMRSLAGLGPGASHRAFVGSGSSRELCRHILRTGASKILIVTDKPLRSLGVVDQVIAPLLESGIELAYYDGVLPDPTYDQVAAGVAVAKAQGTDTILAIGGG